MYVNTEASDQLSVLSNSENIAMYRKHMAYEWQFDGLVQERRNSIANALELRLSYTKPSIYVFMVMLVLRVREVPLLTS